ncbi:hypothetical protein Enr10x_46340 [Gimesia panareensis]|uniref:Uncharacterized protein n=1 Tax=Gimesia panareensis TaxID=2527978 RepID=A0A517QCD0_9PLAN|nr:hypothetical protein [Gimesia panareensis]QDT29283.1 hypothetical protein Enr10x_46340 [Gimesia panareensis]
MSEREQFQAWLDYLPDFLAEFQSFMDESDQEFDYSPESLDALEEWILSHYQDTDDLLKKSESQILNLLACYIGESIIRIRGGQRELDQKPDSVYYRRPVIVLPPYGDTVCPITLATTAADRRTGDFLRSLACSEE